MSLTQVRFLGGDGIVNTIENLADGKMQRLDASTRHAEGEHDNIDTHTHSGYDPRLRTCAAEAEETIRQETATY